MPDARGKRKRRRRSQAKAKNKDKVPSTAPPVVLQAEQASEPKPKPVRKRFSAHSSARAREYIAHAARTDRHALHTAAYWQCDPAEIAACPACQRAASVQAELNAIKVHTMARHGAGTRVAALKKLRGSGATPPVSGGGSHSAVAWGRARRRPRPSGLGPNREDEGQEERRKGEKGGGRANEKLKEARREARGRGDAVRRILKRGEGRRKDAANEDGTDGAGATSRDAARDVPTVLDINNLPQPEIDPALAAMDAAGALDLLPDSGRVSGDLDPGPTGNGPDPHDPREPTPEDLPAPTSASAEPADALAVAVARDFDALAASRARAKAAKAAAVTTTPGDRVRQGWAKRRRDARIAENVAAYLEQTVRRVPKPILKATGTTGTTAGRTVPKKVSFAPVVRAYRPAQEDLGYPHPSLCAAIEEYARTFYIETGAMGRAGLKPAPQQQQQPQGTPRRRESVWDRARRQELEEAGVWDEVRKDRDKEKEEEKRKGEGKRTRMKGEYITRDMTDAFDGTALLHLAILMEEYMAYQLREAGWREGAHRDRDVATPALVVDPHAAPRPKRVYYADVEGERAAQQDATPRRTVRFAGTPREGPTPEIPTVMLDDSSDEEQDGSMEVDDDEEIDNEDSSD